MLTVHCRTRAEAYQPEVRWERIARAVAAVEIPVCGNGGVRTHDDLERMREQTGCRFAMVGHGALADPWIFSGVRATPAGAARFLLEYVEAMPPRRRLPRLKQLVRHWTAGGLFGAPGEHDPRRKHWLRERELAPFLDHLEQTAGVAVS